MPRHCDNVDNDFKSFRTLAGRFRHLNAETARCVTIAPLIVGRERKLIEVNRATAGN